MTSSDFVSLQLFRKLTRDVKSYVQKVTSFEGSLYFLITAVVSDNLKARILS